jgi:PadR family transcriptional regulator AphA
VGIAAGADLKLADHVCLALVGEGAEHGWVVGTMLARDGELGRIWSLSRPLTYRSIDTLVDRGLLTPTGTAQGRGRDRRLLRVTRAGRQVLAAWLDRPVDHLRDVRTELLLKLVLRERAGIANEPLLAAQREHFAPAIAALTSGRRNLDVVDRWRLESARAVERFLRGALRHP